MISVSKVGESCLARGSERFIAIIEIWNLNETKQWEKENPDLIWML